MGAGVSYYLGVGSATSTPEPKVMSVLVNTDGSTCSIQLRNSGSAPTALDTVMISYTSAAGQSTGSVSFAPPNSVLQPGGILKYDCSLTGPSPFVPFFRATSTSPFRIIADFKNGAQVSIVGSFAN